MATGHTPGDVLKPGRSSAMRAATRSLLTAAALCCSPVVAGTGDDVNGTFGRFGFSETVEIRANRCTIRSDIDQAAYVKMIPPLKKLQLLNCELTQTYINTHPNQLTMPLAFMMAPTVIRDFFEQNPTDDGCDFVQTITVTDEYGNDAKRMAFSFDFNRKLFDRIN